MDYFLAFAWFFGHGALWTYGFNALHATPLPCRVIRISERFIAAIAAAPLLAIPWWLELHALAEQNLWLGAYEMFCWASGVSALLCWASRRLHSDVRAGLLSDKSTRLNVQQQLGGGRVTRGKLSFLSAVPGNEVGLLQIHRKTLLTPALPDCWNGIRIAHLTDLHFTGRIAKEYYDVVIDETQSLDADLIVVTGDIVESEKCMEWLESTLGRLSAPLGVFFVLGNHDKRMADVPAVRRRLEELGLRDVGGALVVEQTERGRLLIGGNERPWFKQLAEIPADDDPKTFRLGLLHTPDQFGWAVANRFHCVFAGHTHGGQIPIPIIGPMICPSRYGNRYACGVFRSGDVVMHVGRGLSAMHPIRLRCAPELALVKLVNSPDNDK